MVSESTVMKVVLNFIKLAPRYCVPLGITVAFLLFCPEIALKYFGVFEFAQNNRQWLAIGFILIFAICVVAVTIEATKWGKRFIRSRMLHKRIIERLDSLTEDEKQIVRFYMNNKTRTNVLDFSDGVVQGLVSEGVIVQAANVSVEFEFFSYNISNCAWQYIHKNPLLLEGTTNIARTDKPMFPWEQ